MNQLKATILALIMTLALAAGPALAADKLLVAVGVAPEAFLVERIGGARVAVETLVGPGQSPHTYEPTARQMARLGQVKLIFSIGLPFEEVLIPKVAANNPGLRVVDVRQGLTLRHLAAHEEHEHEHAAEADHHEHGEMDPHVWMSPRLASLMAANMATAMAQADPAGAAVYQANLAALQADLAALDQRLAKALAPLKGREVLVFHPAFGYLLDDHGLRQVAIEGDGKSPGPKRLARLTQQAKAHGVRVIFVQPQFSQKSAQAVAEAIGGAVVPIDPLAHDYIVNLERVAAAIAAAPR